MVMSERPLKRPRRVTADFYDFYSFPAAGDKISDAPFRTAVSCFLSRHARPAFPMASLFPSLTAWQILFRPGSSASGEEDAVGVTLYVVEEDVSRTSRSVYCDHCRVVGWSGHPVCRKRYHFIIPAELYNASGDPLQKQELAGGTPSDCTGSGKIQHLLDSRYKSCNFGSVEDDNIEEWLYSQLDCTTHLLHGVVHSNGYGHLKTLNGREGGSDILSGCDILNFWDRLCQTLAVRKISVMDVSKKYRMEYRLLHAITYGHSWYGSWGYEFGTGSFAITQQSYQEAISYLASLPLSLFSYQGRRSHAPLPELVAFYQSLSDSKLLTLRDLFSFLLLLIRKTKVSFKRGSTDKPECCSNTESSCPWSGDDVTRVDGAMIKVLLATTGGNGGWVSRRALKGALSSTTSPELLDYCLKHLVGKAASNGLVVKSRCNSSSIELRLEPSGSVMSGDKAGLCTDQPTREQIINDIKYICDSVLHPQTLTSFQLQETREMIISSTRRLLDCKHFVKDYMLDQLEATDPSALYIWCHAELADHSKDYPTPPPELVILPENVTIGDLKLEATKAFQEVYVAFKRFEAEKMLDYGPLDDSMTLKLLIGSRGSVRVRGRCPGTHGLDRFRMERGMENWIVDCPCGAKDDDGERMLACDECGTWQHTRCAGIDDNDNVPAKFVCIICLNPELEETNQHQPRNYIVKKKPSSKGRTCRYSV